MDFVDATLVRLADPASREAVFDALALEQLVAAGYDTDALPVEGPFAPLFDEFRMSFFAPQLGSVDGVWNPVGRVDRTEAQFRLSGFGDGMPLRVDAFWRGGVVVRAAPATSRIEDVTTDWPSLAGIDQEIAATPGGLPADPATLEGARRQRLLTRLRAGLSQPDAFTDTAYDIWLAEIGAISTGDLLARFAGAVQPGGVRVTFSPPAAVAPSSLPLPIVAALLIRDNGFSVAQLLAESKVLRDRLTASGLERPPEARLPRRQPLLVVWVISETVFDDPDWPGANSGPPTAARRLRRQAAGAWLAREGIGLVAVTA